MQFYGGEKQAQLRFGRQRQTVIWPTDARVLLRGTDQAIPYDAITGQWWNVRTLCQREIFFGGRMNSSHRELVPRELSPSG